MQIKNTNSLTTTVQYSSPSNFEPTIIKEPIEWLQHYKAHLKSLKNKEFSRVFNGTSLEIIVPEPFPLALGITVISSGLIIADFEFAFISLVLGLYGLYRNYRLIPRRRKAALEHIDHMEIAFKLEIEHDKMKAERIQRDITLARNLAVIGEIPPPQGISLEPDEKCLYFITEASFATYHHANLIAQQTGNLLITQRRCIFTCETQRIALELKDVIATSVKLNSVLSLRVLNSDTNINFHIPGKAYRAEMIIKSCLLD